jgi:hypothetical protein
MKPDDYVTVGKDIWNMLKKMYRCFEVEIFEDGLFDGAV